VFGAALHISPLLAAEKSKVPFFIAGGLLAVWALILSLGLGLRRPKFPGNLGGQRAVIAVSVVLVLAAVSMAIVTAGTPAKPGEGASPSATQPAAPSSSSATAPSSSSATAPSSSSAPAAPAASSQLALAASTGGQLAYDTKQLSTKTGGVTITFTNASPLEHNVTIAEGAKVLGATPTFIGGSRKLTLQLKPGTYTFYCSVPGHRQAGMEGTLRVS
jgi:plastocyanin